MRPRFSVILPVRDRADVVGRAIASLLAQTFAGHEVVVVDRGSTDASVAAAHALGDRRVRVVDATGDDHPRALDRGLEVARGQWIATLAPEDEVAPGWLARLGRILDASDAALVTCGGEQFHHDGSLSRIVPMPLEGYDTRVCSRSGAWIARRRLVREAGGFAAVGPGPRGDEVACERLLVERMVRIADETALPVASTPEPLLRWSDPAPPARWDGDEELQLRWSHQGLDALARAPIPDGALLSRYAVFGGVAAARLRDRREARRLFSLARRLEPRVPAHWARWAATLVPPVADRVWSAPSAR